MQPANPWVNRHGTHSHPYAMEVAQGDKDCQQAEKIGAALGLLFVCLEHPPTDCPDTLATIKGVCNI